MANALPERRRRRRFEVRWRARCVVGDRRVSGLMYDIHRSGGFFTLPEGELCPAVQPGTVIQVDYMPAPYCNVVTTLARVCWTGRSAEHHREGLGLQFDPRVLRDDSGIPRRALDEGEISGPSA